MSKLQTILELVKLLQPYITDLVPIVKAIMEILNQFKDEQPLVGSVDDEVAQLTAAGISEADARELLA